MQIELSNFKRPFQPWHPDMGRVFASFAFDAETTAIDDEQPAFTPALVVAAACDSEQGVFLHRDHIVPFFQAHQGARIIAHNAAFDLRVVDALAGPTLAVYDWVEQNRVWDTMILARLYALATEGHTARGQASLGACAGWYLQVAMHKDRQSAEGRTVRTDFGRYLNLPLSDIPGEHLDYLGQDVIATWHLFQELHQRIRLVLRQAAGAFGYVNDAWLQDAIRRFGPLTHHVQLRASILMDVLRRNGIGIDRERRQEKVQQLEVEVAAAQERLRLRGYLPGEKGCEKALQRIMDRVRREHPDLEFHRTPSGQDWSTTKDHLAELAGVDGFFDDLVLFRTGQKLLATYLNKMGGGRLHAKFGFLLETGRTYCGGGFNLQNLPREKERRNLAQTVRGCFVPPPGHVFIDCDYSQIELVVLGYALDHQFGLGDSLKGLINGGLDVHRLIAAAVVGKDVSMVTKVERDTAKPVSFGRPGGMGVKGLGAVAKASYGLELTEDQIQERIDAYHGLCPELDTYLADEIDGSRVLAERLNMTPNAYNQALGRNPFRSNPEGHEPAGWLGGMLLKVLRDETAQTQAGRPYSPEELDYFWDRAQELPIDFDNGFRSKLMSRQADSKLSGVVRRWAGRRPVFTLTGRLRANATFCSSRNNIFQGTAADGAILGLWRVWRAGFKVVDFIHDQLVVETPATAEVQRQIADIETMMKAGMLEVIPDMNVKVETVVTRSLNKTELDPRYHPPKPVSEIIAASLAA